MAIDNFSATFVADEILRETSNLAIDGPNEGSPKLFTKGPIMKKAQIKNYEKAKRLLLSLPSGKVVALFDISLQN